jgi:malate/lactate dehydrogenase
LLLLQKITGYLPKDDGAKAAFKDADIIVIPAGIPRTIHTLQLMTAEKTD